MTSADSPQGPGSMMSWAWPDIEPQYAALEDMTVSAATGEEFLRQWTAVSASVQELHQRLYVATTQNTADDHVQTRYRNFLDDIYPHVEKAEQRLREKLLAAQVDPPNFDQQLRSMRSEVQLYREENIPLAIEEQSSKTNTTPSSADRQCTGTVATSPYHR